MSRLGNKRLNARRDDTEKAIIEGLEKAGWTVWRELPVDLLLWRADKGYRVLENKSEGKPLVPKKGPQTEFVELTGCPIVNNAIDAIKAVE